MHTALGFRVYGVFAHLQAVLLRLQVAADQEALTALVLHDLFRILQGEGSTLAEGADVSCQHGYIYTS